METLLYLIKNWTSGKFSILQIQLTSQWCFSCHERSTPKFVLGRERIWTKGSYSSSFVSVLSSFRWRWFGDFVRSLIKLFFFSFFVFIFPLLASLNLMDLSLTFICWLFLRCYSNAWYNWWISYLCTNMKYFCHKMCMKQFEVALTAFKMYNFE